ncbi:MAG: hypothetical protein DLM72_15020 [Candidatus Nitrosopolaris wilkensis]|nr:MAG: hypothetical protein DLM72_15020 [Candidatus Nitrosopolaris wilkensis]
MYDEIEGYLPSLLELHRIIKGQRMGEEEIINVLKLANNNGIQLLQERVDYLRSHLTNLEIEHRNKEYNLSTLDSSTKELTYGTNGVYSIPIEDKSIRPVYSNTRLTRRNVFNNNYQISDDSDTEVFYADGSWK